MTGLLQELVELGDHLVADRAVEVVHQVFGLPLVEPRKPVSCKSPWLCERYADLEMWIELFLWFGEGQPNVRAVIGAAHTEADRFHVLARSLAPYVMGSRDRRHHEQRSMLGYVPENFRGPQRIPEGSLGPSNPAFAVMPLREVRSVIWLHPMDEFHRILRDATERDTLALAESVRPLWAFEANGEQGVSAWTIGPQLTDQVIQGSPKVLDEIGEDQGEIVRGRVRFGGQDPVMLTLPRPTIFADEVWLPAPKVLKGVVKEQAMMVRPLDLRPYDRGPRLALPAPVDAGAADRTRVHHG